MNQTPPLPPAWGPQDESHLNLLSIFYYIFAGLGALGGCFLVGHWWLMNALMTGKLGNSSNPPPQEMMALMQVIYVVVGLFIVVGTVMNILAAMFLRQRKNRVFTMVAAGLMCLQFPFGTILGVFTFVVLMRESVREGYERLGREN
jgi:hypothetical protein